MSKLSPWAKARWIVLLSALAALAQPLACSDDEGRLPGTDLSGGPTGQAPNVGPCSEGASAECTVTLGENNGVLSCYKGTQGCESGTWGECGDGSEFTMPVPEFLEQARRGSALSPLALSAPSACLTNPCDPYCRQFDEIPDASLTPLIDHHLPPLPEAGLPLDWPQGSFNRYPPWLITQVQNEPCTTAADCQMNTYCENPDIGTCAHHQCVVGGALASACNPCVQRICAATPSCCTTSWTQACVDAVDTVCGVECGTGPPTSDGTCVPWFPLQTDAECATFDLTVGPTCHDGTNAVIPVCNHGSDWAPPGVKLIHLPPGQLGTTTNPDQTGGAVTCTVDEPIAPGWCVSVTNCSAGLTNDREIMVNPADGTQIAQECQLEDNWSVYRNVACGMPICSGATSRAITRKVNMFFVVDKSGSMDDGAPPTAWFSMRQALKTFFSDPNSEGIYTALRFFPDDVPTPGCNGTACNAAACANPRAEGELLYELAPTDTHEQNLINIVNGAVPNGGTPISVALQGGINWSQARQALRPNEEYVVVLVTDGNPTECVTTQSGIEAIAAGGAATGIRTYVIGIQGVAQTFVNGVAAAGQGQGFFVSTSTSDVAGQLVDALQTIASQSVPCDYSLPNPGAFDPAAASVLFTPSEAPPAFTPACAADQVEADARCYYVIQEAASSWTNARDMCRSLGQGWDIARIRSDAGNTAVRSQEASTRLWIGGSDRTLEGAWTWPDGTQFWQGANPGSSVGGLYAHWDPGEPNQSGDEDCIEMFASGANSGFWNDTNCANTGRKPACEGPRIGETVDGCNPGEVLGPDDNCYMVVTANQSWTAARDACRARGTGWDLAKIASSDDGRLARGADRHNGHLDWVEQPRYRYDLGMG